MESSLYKLSKHLYHNLKVKKYHIKQYKEWVKNGNPIPPPHIVKQKLIHEIKRKYKYNVFIETGTFLGDMVEAQKNKFKTIKSIELSEELHKKAKERFKKYSHIEIYQGDSGQVLTSMLDKIKEPAIFWLDGHYSAGITARGDKDCPIFEELSAILSNDKNHILLIDDARDFIGEGDYPTFEEIKKFITTKNPQYNVDVKNDVIRALF